MKRLTIILPVLTAGILAGAAATELAYQRDAADRATIVIPYCDTEDGSDYPDRHCVWIDPDTGRGYVNAHGYLTAGGQ